MYQTSTTLTAQKTIYLAQDVFKRATLGAMDNVKDPHLYLDNTTPQIATHTSLEAATQARHNLGDTQFSLFTFARANSHIGTTVCNVFTNSSLEVTNTVLGNWDTFQELNFFQAQALSHVSQNLFTEFLRQIEICLNQKQLFSSLTLSGGDINYTDLHVGSLDGFMLTINIPYTLPSVGSGHFLMTTRVAPLFASRLNR